MRRRSRLLRSDIGNAHKRVRKLVRVMVMRSVLAHRKSKRRR